MKHWSPHEKYRQVRKEAGATGVFLALLILFWCVAGFCLSGVEVEVCGLPLWAVLGTVGVWCFAIIGVAVLVRGVFRDMPLEDADDDDHAGGASARRSSAASASAFSPAAKGGAAR